MIETSRPTVTSILDRVVSKYGSKAFLDGCFDCRNLRRMTLLTDILPIPDRCEARIVPSGVLSNAKSGAACAAGGQNRESTAPKR
jgi:hypothetical protein